MALGEIQINFSGNLVEDPTLRFTQSGVPVASFRVACTPRSFNRERQQWEDGTATFLSVQVWRGLAENVTESLRKGTAVMVTGRLQQRSYETKEGERRTVYEVLAEQVAPDLTWQVADVSRARPRNSSGSNDQVAPAVRTQAPTPAPATSTPAPAQPLASAGVFDEPPF